MLARDLRAGLQAEPYTVTDHDPTTLTVAQSGPIAFPNIYALARSFAVPGYESDARADTIAKRNAPCHLRVQASRALGARQAGKQQLAVDRARRRRRKRTAARRVGVR